jgi:head-tail adaptor
MKYRNRETAEILTGTQIKRLNTNVSFAPNTFSDLGWDEVKSTTKPEPTTELKVVYGNGVTQDADGNWVEAWAETDKFSGEDKAEHEAKFLQAKAEALIASFQTSVQDRLDTFAKTRYYNDIVSACTYATSQVAQFAAEGQYCVNARDTTWAYLYGELAKVKAGTRALPASCEELELELPVLEWPE